jgi:hypothetical protein
MPLGILLACALPYKMYSSRQLAEILRDTIRSVEQGTDIGPDDPALLELKRIILLKVAALESEASQESSTQAPAIPPEARMDSN